MSQYRSNQHSEVWPNMTTMCIFGQLLTTNQVYHVLTFRRLCSNRQQPGNNYWFDITW